MAFPELNGGQGKGARGSFPSPRFFLALFLLVFLPSCATIDQPVHFFHEKGTLYRTSMMDAHAYRNMSFIPLQCNKRYMSILGEDRDPSSRNPWNMRIRIEKNWSPGFDNTRHRAVLPMKVTVEKRENGEKSKRTLRGFVEFRDLSACRIRRAAFVPSEDSSVLEPALWVLNVAPPRKDYWSPGLIILTAYRSLINETLSIVGPLPFRTPFRFYHPVAIVNGVVQRKDLLRGVSPPDFRGNLSSSFWLKGRMHQFKMRGEADTGLFEMTSPHTKGVGVLLPFPLPYYMYPEAEYRFALGGSLLVDGPFAFEGVIRFDTGDQTALLKGRINEAGSIVSDFQIQVPYRKGRQSRFGVPGEVDFSFSFNQRRISLVLLPDQGRKAYWIGSLDQNLFGLADPT